MLTFISVLSFFGFIYALVAFILSKTKSKTKVIDLKFKFPVGIASIILFSLCSLITKVGPQEVGTLITPRGVSQEPLRTGWHVVSPWNTVELMDKTLWVYTFSNKKDEGQTKGEDAIWAPTAEGIKMGLDLSISWRIDPDFAPWIYQNVSESDGGDDGRYLWIEKNIIRAKTKSVLSLTVSEYSPIEVYSNKRQDIQDKVLKKLGVELAAYHIKLEQVDIREVFYNPEYEVAINNKKLAEQEAMRLIEVTKQKEEQLKQSSIDKDIVIQTAKGASEALKIKGDAISSNPKIIQLEWINKWNGELPQYMLGNSNIMLNLEKTDK